MLGRGSIVVISRSDHSVCPSERDLFRQNDVRDKTINGAKENWKGTRRFAASTISVRCTSFFAAAFVVETLCRSDCGSDNRLCDKALALVDCVH